MCICILSPSIFHKQQEQAISGKSYLDTSRSLEIFFIIISLLFFKKIYFYLEYFCKHSISNNKIFNVLKNWNYIFNMPDQKHP